MSNGAAMSLRSSPALWSVGNFSTKLTSRRYGVRRNLVTRTSEFPPPGTREVDISKGKRTVNLYHVQENLELNPEGLLRFLLCPFAKEWYDHKKVTNLIYS